MLLDFNSLVNKYNLNIKGVIHIGAHYGQEYDLYKYHNIKNLVFFEPLRDNFSVLEKKLVNENVLLINKALGSKNQKIEMNVETANSGQSSSILEPNLHIKQYPHIIFHKKEVVDMITLDSYFENNNDLIEKYNFINNLRSIDDYELKSTLNYLHDINNIYIIFNEEEKKEIKSIIKKINDDVKNNNTKRVKFNVPNKKTRRRNH